MSDLTEHEPTLPDDLNPVVVEALAKLIGRITGLVPPPTNCFPREWFDAIRAFYQSITELAAYNAAPRDTLAPDERVLFESTVDQFADCNETDTDCATLMDWARRGFLECIHFEVTEKGNSAIAASAAKGTK